MERCFQAPIACHGHRLETLGILRKLGLVACATVIAVAIIVVIELQPVLAAARCLECLVLAALGAVLAVATRGTARNLFVSVCSCLAGLALVEGGVLLLDRGVASASSPSNAAHDSGLSQRRPLLGWGPVKPGVYRVYKTGVDGRPIFDTHVTIDAHLLRKTVPSDGAHPIAFFGDSWIYGDGVDDDGTLPQAFADLNDGRIPVLNLAFAGWSPAQNLVALREGLYGKLIDQPRRFILFTSPFHLERIACRGAYLTSQAPRLVRDGGSVGFAGPCMSARSPFVPLMRIVRRFALYGRLEPLLSSPRRADVETYLAIIEAFAAEAKARYGVGTTILFAPFDERYLAGTGYTEARIVADLRGAGLDVLVDHLPEIADASLYQIPGDGHPTALSNRARAEEIEMHLRQVDPAALGLGTTQ